MCACVRACVCACVRACVLSISVVFEKQGIVWLIHTYVFSSFMTAPKNEENTATKKTDPKEQAVEEKGTVRSLQLM